MDAELAARWKERLATIASNLLTLEVNTILKNGMVGDKMPEVPLALHEIVDGYNSFTGEAGVPVTNRLLVAASARLSGTRHSQTYLTYMQEWAASYPELTQWPELGPEPGLPDPGGTRAVLLTNGSETFEALIWAATAARNSLARDQTGQPGNRQRRAALLTRIMENCRQLREVAIVLEKAFSSVEQAPDQARITGLQSSRLRYVDRLDELIANGGVVSADQPSRLFGGTVDQTTQALFRHPRPILNIDPDLTVLIRKVWDIALEEVLFQTSIQVDGDVLVRVAEMPKDQRDFLAALHRTAVADGVEQWRLLFATVRDLVSVLLDSVLRLRGPGASAN